jgi:hypothetical protein
MLLSTVNSLSWSSEEIRCLLNSSFKRVSMQFLRQKLSIACISRIRPIIEPARLLRALGANRGFFLSPLNDFLTSHLTYSMLRSIPICTGYNQGGRRRYMIYGVGSRISLHCIPRHMMRPRMRVMRL